MQNSAECAIGVESVLDVGSRELCKWKPSEERDLSVEGSGSARGALGCAMCPRGEACQRGQAGGQCARQPGRPCACPGAALSVSGRGNARGRPSAAGGRRERAGTERGPAGGGTADMCRMSFKVSCAAQDGRAGSGSSTRFTEAFLTFRPGW